MTKHEFAEKWSCEDRQHYNELMADLNQLETEPEKIQNKNIKVNHDVPSEWSPTMNLRWKHDYGHMVLQQEWQCSNGESRWDPINHIY